MKASAYRSMNLAKQGKTNPQNKGGLRRWINEDWRNLTPYAYNITTLSGSPACGDSSKNPRGQKSVCRPMKAVSSNTPTLASTYTKKQIRKAVALKNKGQVIMWEKL